LNTSLDFLELAEREGGLSTWLEQWNDMLFSPWSWDTLAESAGKIKQGIEFCKEMVREGFGDLTRMGNEPLKNRSDLLFALDAIALEITSQAEAVLAGNRLDLGKPFDSITLRLRELSPRAGIEAHLHDACAKGNLALTWAAELPDAIRQNGEAAGLSSGLSDALTRWQLAVDNVRDIVSSEHAESDEAQAADTLNTVATQMAQNFTDLIAAATSPSRAFDPDQISLSLQVYKRLATEIIEQHKALAAQLGELSARRTLVNGTGTQGLSRFNFERSEPTAKERAEKHARRSASRNRAVTERALAPAAMS
jgi:hypothetical protein